MTFEIVFVLALLVAAVVLFITEKLRVDLVALIVMAALLVSGIITPEEGIAGFSNPATVTVAAMFVLSHGLFKTGAINLIGNGLTMIGRRSYWVAVLAMMLLIGGISAFINNTAAVALFLPIVIGLARDLRVSPSKLLMPLSFASMFGGVCTLIGTSTNILVNSIGIAHRQPPFEMFEFAPLGLIMFAAGTLYMLAIGTRLIPNRRTSKDLTETFGMGDYLTEIILLPEAKSVGKSIKDSPLIEEMDVDIIEIYRDQELLSPPSPETVLQANDLLRVRCNVEMIRKLEDRVGVVLKSGLKWRDEDLQSAEAILVEAVIAPGSPLEGRSLKEADFRNSYGATALAIRHRGTVMRENLGNIPLKAGDVLLIEVRRDRLSQLKRNQAFVVVSELPVQDFRKGKIVPALVIIAGVVIAATLNILPIVAGAIIGSVLFVATGVIDLEEAYEAIDWQVIFLLAGILTLGTALETTGAARLISSAILKTFGVWGPVAMIAAFYLLTSLLTEAMSNNASAAMIAPIAITTAETIGVSPRPFLVAVAFAASASFMTPVGYQTNTLIYGPGQYRFSDFLRVGTPLNLIFWVVATLLIPQFWPF
ncbi:MAG TPA: SLC13 family permease [Blastocatellia bacterium]|jgi:di/tricarboxylate transporter